MSVLNDSLTWTVAMEGTASIRRWQAVTAPGGLVWFDTKYLGYVLKPGVYLDSVPGTRYLMLVVMRRRDTVETGSDERDTTLQDRQDRRLLEDIE